MSKPKSSAGKAPAVGDRLQVEIEKLAIGGSGLARPDGFVLFVPDTAPGDVAEVEVTSAKGRHGEGRLLRLISPSPDRQVPPCSFATDCGGCNWQHLTAEAQRQWKHRLLAETLRKFFQQEDLPLLPFVSSPRELEYRNRVQPRYENGRLGYRKRGSHQFLPVSDCLIVEEPLREYFRKPERLNARFSTPTRLELKLTEEGQVTVSDEGSRDEEGFAFSQVNRFQNEDLVRTSLHWVKDLDPSALWDLYCGGGNFSFPLAEQFPHRPLVGVDLSRKLIQKAQMRTSDSRFRFLQADVEKWVQKQEIPRDSLIFLDPPRAGAGLSVMQKLASSEAKALLYIACHPVSLARDLAELFKVAPGRWRLTKVQGFEMFPQNDHFESMALVTRLG